MGEEWVPEVGDTVFTFNTVTRRCVEQVVERVQGGCPSVGGGNWICVYLIRKDLKSALGLECIGRTEQEAEQKYYECALKERGHWQGLVDFFENKTEGKI